MVSVMISLGIFGKVIAVRYGKMHQVMEIGNHGPPLPLFCEVIFMFDEDGIRTHAGRAQWISSPSP